MLQAAEALGLKVLELPTDASTGIDLPALERAVDSRTVKACLFSSCFSNPLGYTMTEDKKTAILNMLAHHQVPLIEDDIYGDIYFGQDRPAPFMALDRHDNTIYCSSFSKTIAPGYRIGWVVSRPSYAKAAGDEICHLALRPRPAAGGTSRVPFVRRI